MYRKKRLALAKAEASPKRTSSAAKPLPSPPSSGSYKRSDINNESTNNTIPVATTVSSSSSNNGILAAIPLPAAVARVANTAIGIARNTYESDDIKDH